jgi:hypothetical protein
VNTSTIELGLALAGPEEEPAEDIEIELTG